MSGDLLDFRDRYPHAPGYRDLDTSRDAAHGVAGRANLLRDRCMAALTRKPMTADETADALGENLLSIRPRITELIRLGKIEDSGDRRANASGRRAKVWRVI